MSRQLMICRPYKPHKFSGNGKYWICEYSFNTFAEACRYVFLFHGIEVDLSVFLEEDDKLRICEEISTIIEILFDGKELSLEEILKDQQAKSNVV